MGRISMYRHSDWATRLPGEEVDESEGKMESLAGGSASGTQRGGAELNASPGVILDNCVLGEAKESGTEVHAHGRVPAITVILGRAEEKAETSEDRSGRGDTQPWTRDLGSWHGGTGGCWDCLTLTCSNICMVGKVLREQTKPSGLRKPATTFGTPRRND